MMEKAGTDESEGRSVDVDEVCRRNDGRRLREAACTVKSAAPPCDVAVRTQRNAAATLNVDGACINAFAAALDISLPKVPC